MAILSSAYARAKERGRQVMQGAARSGAPGKLIALRHGQTYYHLDGPEDAPLMICIHGWSTASYVWEPLRQHFRAKGYRLLTYDLYGRGFSDRPHAPNTAEFFDGQLTELLERLGLHSAPLTVTGYSMGGAIAARFVSKRLEQVRRLVLIAPAGMAVRSDFVRKVLRALPRTLEPHAEAFLPAILPKVFDKEAAGFEANPEVARVLRNQKRELRFQGYVPALVSSVQGILAASMEREHRRIAQAGLPVKALFAANDTTIPLDPAKARFEEWNSLAQSHALASTGHGVTYTHPELIMETLGDFLDLP